MMEERELRIAQNRARELEEKRAKLHLHDLHVREVAERKLKLLAAEAPEVGDNLEMVNVLLCDASKANPKLPIALRSVDSTLLPVGLEG
jgi:hypothetical protein